MLYLGVDGRLGSHGPPQLLPLRALQGELRGHLPGSTSSLKTLRSTPSSLRRRSRAWPLTGMESLFVLVPVPHLGPNVDWDRDGDAFKEKVYGLLENGGAGSKREPGRLREGRGRRSTGETSTTWRRGPRSASGTASCRSGTSGLRWYRRPYEGLYFVGASTRPGTGVPLVTIGAQAGGRPHRARGRRRLKLDPAGGKKLDAGLSLAESYELCRKVQKAHSRTYYFSTRLFPRRGRPRVHALYAFMRYADEIVDHPTRPALEAQLAVLEEFEAETMAAVSGEAVPNPVLRAYADTVRALRHRRRRTIAAFMKSMKMDTRVFRYRTYSDLEVIHLRERRRGRPDDVQGRGGGGREGRPHAEAPRRRHAALQLPARRRGGLAARAGVSAAGGSGALRVHGAGARLRRRGRAVRRADALRDRAGAQALRRSPTRGWNTSRGGGVSPW